MKQSLVATATVTLKASNPQIWHALLDPEMIKKYMFGTTVTSDWQVGSTITWAGDYKGKRYSDHGLILHVDRGRQLKYSHFSPAEGKLDLPENYHTVTINLSTEGARTVLTLSQDNNPTEAARQESEKNWQTMLENLKKVLEG